MSQTHLDYIVCKIVAKIFQKVAQSGHAVWLSSIFWPTFGRRVQSGFCDQLSGVKNCVKNCFSETLKRKQKAAGRSVVKSCEKLLCSTRCNPDNGHHWSLYSWCPVWQDWTWPTKENMRLFVCMEAVESKPVIAQWYFPPTVNFLWTIWWKLLLHKSTLKANV